MVLITNSASIIFFSPPKIASTKYLPCRSVLCHDLAGIFAVRYENGMRQSLLCGSRSQTHILAACESVRDVRIHAKLNFTVGQNTKTIQSIPRFYSPNLKSTVPKLRTEARYIQENARRVKVETLLPSQNDFQFEHFRFHNNFWTNKTLPQVCEL